MPQHLMRRHQPFELVAQRRLSLAPDAIPHEHAASVRMQALERVPEEGLRLVAVRELTTRGFPKRKDVRRHQSRSSLSCSALLMATAAFTPSAAATTTNCASREASPATKTPG